jgi:hypothetical protein
MESELQRRLQLQRKLQSKNPFTFFTDPERAEEYIKLVHQAMNSGKNSRFSGFSGFVQTNSVDVKKWNAFIRTLKTSSANGIINLGAIQSRKGPQWLVKTDISPNSDPILYEHYIGTRMNALRRFVPNFALTFGGFRCEVNLFDRQDAKAQMIRPRPKMIHEFCSPPNLKPLKDKRKKKEFIISEKIEPASSLGSYVQTHSVTKSLFALIQVLCAVQVAQNELDFTHYDLHAENVIRQNMPSEWGSHPVFMYNLNSTSRFDPDLVIPVPAEAIWTVIDFGRSHVNDTPQRIRKLWSQHSSYQSFARDGLDPLESNPIFDVIRLVSQASTYNPELAKVKNRVKDWDKCFTRERYANGKQTVGVHKSRHQCLFQSEKDF